MENNNGNNKIFIYLLVVFFAVFIGSGLFLFVTNKKNSINNQAAVTSMIKPSVGVAPTTVVSRGYIKFKPDLTTNKLSGPLNLTLTADSNGDNVTAFDILISYDPMAFEFVSAKSADPNFQVYPYVKDGGLDLTVVKTGSSATPSVFKDEDVVNLVFQPKKIGQSTFKVVPSIGKETTKFVNDKTEVIYPEMNSILITVE